MSAATKQQAAGELTEHRRRLALSDAYTQLVALFEQVLTRGRQASESVTLKANAKHETQPEVVAVPGDGETLREAALRAAAIYDELRERYPVNHV